METKQWRHCWYLDFFIIFALLIVVKFMFYSYFERKNDKVLTFNIVHVPKFEISTSLKLAPHLTVSKFNKSRRRLLEGIRCWVNFTFFWKVSRSYNPFYSFGGRIPYYNCRKPCLQMSTTFIFWTLQNIWLVDIFGIFFRLVV